MVFSFCFILIACIFIANGGNWLYTLSADKEGGQPFVMLM